MTVHATELLITQMRADAFAAGRKEERESLIGQAASRALVVDGTDCSPQNVQELVNRVDSLIRQRNSAETRNAELEVFRDSAQGTINHFRNRADKAEVSLMRLRAYIDSMPFADEWPAVKARLTELEELTARLSRLNAGLQRGQAEAWEQGFGAASDGEFMPEPGANPYAT